MLTPTLLALFKLCVSYKSWFSLDCFAVTQTLNNCLSYGSQRRKPLVSRLCEPYLSKYFCLDCGRSNPVRTNIFLSSCHPHLLNNAYLYCFLIFLAGNNSRETAIHTTYTLFLNPLFIPPKKPLYFFVTSNDMSVPK